MSKKVGHQNRLFIQAITKFAQTIHKLIGMSAILKEIRFLEDIVIEDKLHPIIMCFSRSVEENELYFYRTSLENQYCSFLERTEGLSEEKVDAILEHANSQIGKIFDINLFDISVSELTDGQFVSLEYDGDLDEYGYEENEDCDEDDIIKEFRRATYKTRADIFEVLKLHICLWGLDKTYIGIKSDGSYGEIDEKLVFPINRIEPKHYDIPYDGFPEVDEFYILNEIPIENIENGQYLAISLKYNNIKNFDGTFLIRRLKEYRNQIIQSNYNNGTLRKKIAFWEPKETVGPFNPTKDTIIECNRETVLHFFKDSYILSKAYPKDCLNAKTDYHRKCEEELREQFCGEQIGEKRVKEKLKMILKEQSAKYKGKRKITMIG